MLHKISLLEELKKGGYEASLITTYNAYLPFYEEVVLRRMVSAGIRHNVLLMDASQYTRSLNGAPPRHAGRQYSLLPVTVPGAFHPKLVFLAGKNRGLILIGSHNMTLAGFGFNRETTGLVRIAGDKDATGIALANDVTAAVDHWLQHFTPGLPDHARKMVQRVWEFAPWLTNDASPNADIHLLAGHPGGTPLWDQLTLLSQGDAEHVGVSGAFFDRKLSFITRIRDDLKPKRLTVAVDPATVELDQNAKSLQGVSFADASKLGVENENDTGGYLHAKSIYVESANGNLVFAVGSANPSRPAWLADNARGNVELMLAYRGDDARTAANATGLDAMHELPLLDDEGWQAIAQKVTSEEDIAVSGPRTGIAVAERDRIVFDLQLCNNPTEMEFILYGAGSEEISRTSACKIDGTTVVLEFNGVAPYATFLNGYFGADLSLKLLLHHSALVEEHARTGPQRRLKDALQSLDTDTPNIELLVQCLDKIVFGDEQISQSSAMKKSGSNAQSATDEPEDRGTLAIHADEMRKRGRKQRLHHSSDFAYLLDTLIYHLGIREDQPPEDRDRFGRSEEEQVGADDEPAPDNELISPERQAAILDICHSKVATITRRITSQLTACAEGRQPFYPVTIRLLGVLAVLRELRRCDGRVGWVEKGKTTVPHEERRKLLQAIMLTLFERNAEGLSLLDLHQADGGFENSDDIARLKGLVLWLAWDSGLTLDLQKPTMESPEGQQNRIHANAMVLALAQMIHSDDVVIDEARQSIGSLTSSELDWLEAVQTLAVQCDSLFESPDQLLPAQKAEPGDIAIHHTVRPWHLRIVMSQNNKQTRLIKLTVEGKPISYRSDHLSVSHFDR